MEDIRINGGFLKDALQHITPLAVKGAGLFEKNSIILATTATIGVHAMLIADSLANQQFTNFKVRKSLSDEYIDEFIYYSFFKIDEWSKNNTNSGGLLSVNMPLLVKQGFLTPCKEEQQTIASYFRILDAKLQASTKKVESLKKLKSASLVAMFPQNGESMPKVRFKGFEGEWNECKLGEICYKRSSFHTEGHLGANCGKYPIYGATGYIQNIETYDVDVPYVSIVKDGSGVGRVELNPAFSSVLGTMQYLLVKPQNSIAYLLSLLQTFDFSEFTNGSSIPHIYFKDYALKEIKVPSLEEQQKIGSYFITLDRKIALETARLEKLKQIKRACLDKMFV